MRPTERLSAGRAAGRAPAPSVCEYVWAATRFWCKLSALLAAKARAKGLSAEECAQQVLEHDLVPEWLGKSWQTVEIAAARKARREPRLHPGL